MEAAIDIGFANSGPEIQAYWQSIPCEGERPRPEEWLAFASLQMYCL